MTVLSFMDLFGTLTFALSGALAAIKKDMDLFGVMVLAFVTAVGGGITRDILLGQTPVFALLDPAYALVILTGSFLAACFYHFLTRLNSAILIADAFGLGTFVCIGVSKALHAGIPFSGAVILGVITAILGGIIRDVLAGEVPAVLTRDFYAMACVAGGLIFILLHIVQVKEEIIMFTSAGATILLRLFAIRYRWNFIKVPAARALLRSAGTDCRSD